MRWTQEQYEEYLRRNPGSKIHGAKFEPAIPDEPVATPKGKTKSPECIAERIVVRIKSLRCRLLDPDNLCPKYIIDALRYAGAIPNDREADVILQISQERVATKKEQRTLVELLDSKAD